MQFAPHLRALTLVSACLAASTAFAAPNAVVSQEVWAGPEPVVVGQPLTRAEVQADWQLWQQAGLDAYVQGDRSFANDPSYDARLAQYQQSRKGTAYTALVQRLQAQAQ